MQIAVRDQNGLLHMSYTRLSTVSAHVNTHVYSLYPCLYTCLHTCLHTCPHTCLQQGQRQCDGLRRRVGMQDVVRPLQRGACDDDELLCMALRRRDN